MKAGKIIFIVLASLSLIFNSCKKKEKDPEPEPAPAPIPGPCTPVIVLVSTGISSPTTWNACNIYVIDALGISVSSTLTIEPGTVIKFKDNVGDNAILVSASGRIIAEGTAEKPVVFTSVKDDAHGGDSNGDGALSAPARADWGGLIFNNNNCVFRYCEFFYGGEGPNVGAGQPTLEFMMYYGVVDHCTFAYCGGETSYDGYGVIDARSSESNDMKITNSIFYGCIKPIFISPHISIDNSNSFHNPTDVNIKNQLNGIFLTSTANEATTDVSWLETEVPFVLTGGTSLEDSRKLILAPGVIIKVALLPARGYGKIALKEGKSFIENYSAAGVYFTSYLDDAHGGDTNGDGTATAPADGDWYGIQDLSATIGTNNNCYGWANILYAEYP
jgi:hypothetical protein